MLGFGLAGLLALELDRPAMPPGGQLTGARPRWAAGKSRYIRDEIIWKNFMSAQELRVHSFDTFQQTTPVTSKKPSADPCLAEQLQRPVSPSNLAAAIAAPLSQRCGPCPPQSCAKSAPTPSTLKR